METTLFNLLDGEEYLPIEREKLKFGIQIILTEFYKLLFIYLIAFLLNCIVPTLIIHLIFFLLRQVCLGYHFKNLYVCLIWSAMVFPVVAHYLTNLNIKLQVAYLYTGISIFILFIYMLAPKGTKNQPIINRKHRNYLRKKMTIRLLLIVVIFCFSPLKIKVFIIYGVFLETIMLIVQTLKGRLFNEQEKNF